MISGRHRIEAADNPFVFRRRFSRPAKVRWQRDCSSFSEPFAFDASPAAPARILFRIPNGLTESVPKGILLLQTAVVSIH
jgi:hypothetical protein